MVALRFLIPSFVAPGLEPSVAHMFLLPLGMVHGPAAAWAPCAMTHRPPRPPGTTLAGP